MPTDIEIRSESDLFQAIDTLKSGRWPEDQGIRFVDWPRYEITISGEDFDGGVPTRIMPALLELQKSVNRAYARSVYGDERRRLKKGELKDVELIVRLKAGSTTFEADLTEVLNRAVQAAIKNMSGPETLAAIFGIAAIFTAGWVWKAKINAAAREREIDHQTRVSEEETKRLEVITELAGRYATVSEHLADVNASQTDLLKRLDKNDRLVLDGEEIVSGETAARLVRRVPAARVQDRMDADFVILSVESGGIQSGFRARVRNVETQEELTVSIPEGTLPPEQITDLQSGEWRKAPLHMRINIERTGNRIINATLVSAGLSKKGSKN